MTIFSRDSLNALGWEKVFVNFGGVLPLAHLQICANERWPEYITSPMGVDVGQELMDDSAEYLVCGAFADKGASKITLLQTTGNEEKTKSLNKQQPVTLNI